MAVLPYTVEMMDSFDHYANTSPTNLPVSQASRKWTFANFTTRTPGRNGSGQAIQGNCFVTLPNPPGGRANFLTITAGVGFQQPGFLGAKVFHLFDQSTAGGFFEYFTLTTLSDGRFQAIGRGVADTPSGFATQVNTWYYVELFLTIAATTMTYTVRVNGNNVVINGQVITTTSQPNPGVISVGLGQGIGGGSSNYPYFDDFFVTDGGGGVSAMAGDVSIGVIRPDSPGTHTSMTVPASTPTSYLNQLSQGDRSPTNPNTGFPFVVVAASPGLISGGGNLEWLVDGAINIGGNYITFGSNPVAGLWLSFDFGSPYQLVIDEATIYFDQTGDLVDNSGVWQWQGSNDNSTWTNVGATFTLAGSGLSQISTTLHGNTTQYRYYRILGVSGSGNIGIRFSEFNFRTGFTQLVAGSANWQQASDNFPDDQLSIVQASQSGLPLLETYGMQDIPTNANVKGIQGVICAQKDQDGSASFSPAYRSGGGTDFTSALVFFPSFGSWAMFRDPYANSVFTGNQWTAAEINAMEFGQKRLT